MTGAGTGATNDGQGITAGKDSALMTILRRTDDAAKMDALRVFDFQVTAKSTGEGMSDDYSTEVVPDSFDEVMVACLAGLITREQISQLRQKWEAEEVGDGPAQRAGTWKPPAPAEE